MTTSTSESDGDVKPTNSKEYEEGRAMPSMPRHSEIAFETVIEQHLLGHGYVAVSRDGFDRERAIFPSVVLDFIKDTQPKEWGKLEALHGPKTGEQIL